MVAIVNLTSLSESYLHTFNKFSFVKFLKTIFYLLAFKVKQLDQSSKIQYREEDTVQEVRVQGCNTTILVL